MTRLFSQQIARSFSRASGSYIDAARLQQQVAFDALDWLPTAQTSLLDLGCGPGWLHPQLTQYCQQLLALDFSEGMLQHAAQLQLASRYIQADAANIPLNANSVDAVFSSLMLQWCANPTLVLHEVDRILVPTGTAVISTLVAGTLCELQYAFAQLDDLPHIHHFRPLAELQQMAVNAQQTSQTEWQLVSRSYPLYYPDVFALLRELKALGANQIAQRRAGLSGKAYWQQLAKIYEQFRTEQGVTASYQVVYLIGRKKAA